MATKVCHLGDQLEGVNTPRQRAVEAQRLMTYFNEFLDGDLRSDVFNNPEKVSLSQIPRNTVMTYSSRWMGGFYLVLNRAYVCSGSC